MHALLPSPKAVFALLAVAVIPPGGRADKPADKPATPQEMIIRLTNEFRRSQKVPPLKADETLARVAQKHAENMARQNKAGHFLDGKTPVDRAKAAGYKHPVGENVAATTARANLARGFVASWKKSPPHRKSMLNPDYTEIGVGVARSKSGVWYACQVFGMPAAGLKRPLARASVTNGTDQPLRLTIGVGSTDLPAGREVTVVGGGTGPTIVMQVRPKAPAKSIRVTLRNGGKYTIVSDGGALKLRDDK